MNDKQIQFQKRRELGDIISDSFEFLKSEFRPLSKLIIRYVLPFVLVYAGLQVYVQIKVIGKIDFSEPEMFLSNIGPVYLNFFLASLFAVFVQSLLVGTFYSYLELYIKKGKGQFDPDELKEVLFSNTLIALGANLVVFFITLIGVIMCILPGIFFANSLSLVLMVLFMEKKGLADALTRSWQLVHKQWWNTLIINILGVVIIYVAGFIVTLPSALIGGYGMVGNSGGTEMPGFPSLYWILQGLSAAVSVLLWIVPFTFLAFQYYNLKERYESKPPAENV